MAGLAKGLLSVLFDSHLLKFVHHQPAATTNQGLRPLIAGLFVFKKKLYDNPLPLLEAGKSPPLFIGK